MRFRFHVLEEYAVSHGIPHRVGPTVSVPGEHGGDVADVADPVVAVAFGGVLERRRTTPSVYVLSAPSGAVPWLASPIMRIRGLASA